MREADTLIVVAARGSTVYQHTLAYLRKPSVLEPDAVKTFDAALEVFERTFGDGGVLGMLLFPGFHKVGPTVVMGRVPAVEQIVESLALRAREIARSSTTPVLMDEVLEGAARSAIVRVSATEGTA